MFRKGIGAALCACLPLVRQLSNPVCGHFRMGDAAVIDTIPFSSVPVRGLDSTHPQTDLADGRYVVRIESGRIVSSALMHDGFCVVDPTNRTQLEGLLRECVHPSLLASVMATFQGE